MSTPVHVSIQTGPGQIFPRGLCGHWPSCFFVSERVLSQSIYKLVWSHKKLVQLRVENVSTSIKLVIYIKQEDHRQLRCPTHDQRKTNPAHFTLSSNMLLLLVLRVLLMAIDSTTTKL